MRWRAAAPMAAFAGGDVIGVECRGRRLALYRIEGEVFATSDVCPHQGAPLSRGCLVGGYVECPAHFALFDVRTGAADGGTTTRAVRTFPAKVEDGVVYVDLSDVEEKDDD